MKKYILTAAMLTALNFNCISNVEANEDDEISIMAAEQRDIKEGNDSDNEIETFERNKNENKNDVKKPPSTQQNPVPEKITPPVPEKPEEPIKTNPPEKVVPVEPVIQAEPVKNPEPPVTPAPQNNVSSIDQLKDSTGMPSPIVTYQNFEEAAKKVGFIPLYIPKKSGFEMNYIAVINGNTAEIRYGRRWEPSVVLSVRTYKRAPGEELKDISGIYGVKWKIDMSSGTTIYIARVSDTANAAAWAVGQYTFAATTESLSFASFHALIVEELVDLCNHYYLGL